MIRTHIDTHRAATPTLEAGVANAVNPPPAEAPDKAMSIEKLRMCPIPPLHDNPFSGYADADQKTLDWLYNGAKPQSLAEVDGLACFCVKQKLPDALSWLVLQCEVDKLNLRRGHLGVEGVQMIASWLERCPRSIALDFSCQEIGEEGAIALAAALKTSSTVTSLDVTFNSIGDIGALAFSDMLKTNSTLTSLNVSGNGIRDTGAVALADALKTNSTLTLLNVSGNNYGRFSDIGAVAFAAALKSNSTLTSLDASNNNIGATGAVAFADALKPNSTLTSLKVACNSISDAGAVAIADALGTNSTLTLLDVADNHIGISGAEAFALTLKTNSTLTSLRVDFNNVDTNGVTTPTWRDDADFTSAFAKHQAEIDRRLGMNAKAKPLVLPAAEAFMTLPASWELKLPLEVGALIVKDMITLGPDKGDGLEGLKSLVIASDIVKPRPDETR